MADHDGVFLELFSKIPDQEETPLFKAFGETKRDSTLEKLRICRAVREIKKKLVRKVVAKCKNEKLQFSAPFSPFK